ncbi:MAG: CoA transferase [Dehalococcoidia bacterium]
MAETSPLSGVRVIECCGWSGAYAGKLLAEAGADVVRVVPPSGDPLAAEPPFFDGGGVSIQATWYNLGKRVVEIDFATADGRSAFASLVAGADILFDDWRPETAPIADVVVAGANAGLVRVTITPTGRTGAPLRTNDLVANAMSGSASVTGDLGAPPLTGYGNQSHHTVGMYGTIVALAGLFALRRTGQGTHIDLSEHEALVSCTEQVLMQWFFEGAWPRIANRQGNLHWSGAYAVYPDKHGQGLHVTSALRFLDEVLPWMTETGGAGDLADSAAYPDLISLVKVMPHVMATMKAWVATLDAGDAFAKAQRKRLPWGPVFDVPTVAASPQLAARAYFQPEPVPGAGVVQLPGRLFQTDVDAERPAAPVAATATSVAWSRRPGLPRSPKLARPLEGVRILDFTHVLAGPFGTRVLADLGADVLKVSSASRSGGANSAAHPYFRSWNRNKRSIQIDMGRAEGRALARQLAGSCDAVIENFSAGVLTRWGLDREGLKEINPKVTVVSMGGMGQTGPWRDFVTFAPTIHALCGLTDLTNQPGEHLAGYGFSLTDHLSGLAGAIAILEGVERARRTGQGMAVDLSQYEVGLGIMAPAFIDYLNNGVVPQPTGNAHPFAAWAPHGIYATSDGWLALAVRGDDEFARLAATMAQPGLATDARFRDHAGRAANAVALDAAIAAWAARQARYAAATALQSAGIASGPVQDASDLTARDAALRERRFFGQAVDSGGSTGHPVDQFPALIDGERPSTYRAAHQAGADTFEVLADVMGLDDEAIAGLMAEGVLT